MYNLFDLKIRFYSTTETARMEWKNEMRHNSSHLHVYRGVCINLLRVPTIYMCVCSRSGNGTNQGYIQLAINFCHTADLGEDW